MKPLDAYPSVEIFHHDDKTQQRLKELRQVVDKTVGSVFYGTLLKASRNSPFKGAYGHGGRGEEVFMAQLHQTLSERAAAARSYELNESIYQQMREATIRRSSSIKGNHE